MKKYFTPEIKVINTMEIGDIVTISGGGTQIMSYMGWSSGIDNDPFAK